MKQELTQARLKELLHYDPETGIFTWLVYLGRNAPRAGAKAGTVNNHGYIRIKIDGTLYKAHRLAFLYMTGAWPTHEVDHVNGKRADNRWCNLREATRAQNVANRPLQANNASGVKGVYWHKRLQKWLAKIKVNGKTKRLGYFETQFDAMNAYQLFAYDQHGAYAHFGGEGTYPPTLQIMSELYPDILQ